MSASAAQPKKPATLDQAIAACFKNGKIASDTEKAAIPALAKFIREAQPPLSDEERERGYAQLTSILGMLFQEQPLQKPKFDLPTYFNKFLEQVIEHDPDTSGAIYGYGKKALSQLKPKTEAMLSINPKSIVKLASHLETAPSSSPEIEILLCDSLHAQLSSKNKSYRNSERNAFLKQITTEPALCKEGSETYAIIEALTTKLVARKDLDIEGLKYSAVQNFYQATSVDSKIKNINNASRFECFKDAMEKGLHKDIAKLFSGSSAERKVTFNLKEAALTLSSIVAAWITYDTATQENASTEKTLKKFFNATDPYISKLDANDRDKLILEINGHYPSLEFNKKYQAYSQLRAAKQEGWKDDELDRKFKAILEIAKKLSGQKGGEQQLTEALIQLDAINQSGSQASSYGWNHLRDNLERQKPNIDVQIKDRILSCYAEHQKKLESHELMSRNQKRIDLALQALNVGQTHYQCDPTNVQRSPKGRHDRLAGFHRTAIMPGVPSGLGPHVERAKQVVVEKENISFASDLSAILVDERILVEDKMPLIIQISLMKHPGAYRQIFDDFVAKHSLDGVARIVTKCNEAPELNKDDANPNQAKRAAAQLALCVLEQPERRAELMKDKASCQTLLSCIDHLSPDELKTLFSSWTRKDFESFDAPMVGQKDIQSILAWGLLTQDKIGSPLTPDEISAAVKKLNLSALSAGAMHILPLAVRRAVLLNFKDWNETKRALGEAIHEKSAALTQDDVTWIDIAAAKDVKTPRELETAMMFLFKKDNTEREAIATYLESVQAHAEAGEVEYHLSAEVEAHGFLQSKRPEIIGRGILNGILRSAISLSDRLAKKALARWKPGWPLPRTVISYIETDLNSPPAGITVPGLIAIFSHSHLMQKLMEAPDGLLNASADFKMYNWITEITKRNFSLGDFQRIYNALSKSQDAQSNIIGYLPQILKNNIDIKKGKANWDAMRVLCDAYINDAGATAKTIGHNNKVHTEEAVREEAVRKASVELIKAIRDSDIDQDEKKEKKEKLIGQLASCHPAILDAYLKENAATMPDSTPAWFFKSIAKGAAMVAGVILIWTVGKMIWNFFTAPAAIVGGLVGVAREALQSDAVTIAKMFVGPAYVTGAALVGVHALPILIGILAVGAVFAIGWGMQAAWDACKSNEQEEEKFHALAHAFSKDQLAHPENSLRNIMTAPLEGGDLSQETKAMRAALATTIASLETKGFEFDKVDGIDQDAKDAIKALKEQELAKAHRVWTGCKRAPLFMAAFIIDLIPLIVSLSILYMKWPFIGEAPSYKKAWAPFKVPLFPPDDMEKAYFKTDYLESLRPLASSMAHVVETLAHCSNPPHNYSFEATRQKAPLSPALPAASAPSSPVKQRVVTLGGDDHSRSAPNSPSPKRGSN